MPENKDKSRESMDSRSAHTIEGQKELMDYAMKAGRKNMVKMFLTVFPIMILITLVLIGALFYFLGLLT